MPQIRVLKNTEPWCIVGSDDVWGCTVCLWADLWGPERSMLDVTGRSKLRDDGSRDLLIWTLPVGLDSPDVIDLFFEEGSVSEPEGERFESEGSQAGHGRLQPRPPSESELLEWEARSPDNEAVRWKVVVNEQAPIIVGPTRQRQQVSLRTIWNEERPYRWRVSLSTSSLREMCCRTGGTELFLDHLPIDSHVRVSIDA